MGVNEKAFTATRKVTWKSNDVTRFDSKRFKQEEPELFKKYSNTTSERKFLIKQKENVNGNKYTSETSTSE